MITSDGTPHGRAQAMVTGRNIGQFFGDRPLEILSEISAAQNTPTLRQLNQRARSLTVRYLTSAASSAWLSRFTSAVDKAILKRNVELAGAADLRVCWCFCGAAGRGESITRLAPHVALIAPDEGDPARWQRASEAVVELMNQCGYLPHADKPFEPLFYSAPESEWKQRFSGWLSDPILNQIYRARPLFDLLPVVGDESLWQQLKASTNSGLNGEFLTIVANDCLATLPPLTFFQNAVVDEAGEETSVFRLEECVLRPLVDVGRVFGMAAGNVFGSSTAERFAMARDLVADQAPIFDAASDALRAVLWQQGRVGITENTSGMEISPALLGPYERQILRHGFHSILRLLEFTGEFEWLKVR